MPRRCLLILLFLSLGCPLRVPAAPAKTSDLVIIAGGKSSEYWKAEDKLKFDSQESYLALGTLTVAPRSKESLLTEMALWGQGINSVAFFDLTPLQGVLDEASNVDEARRLLLDTSTKSPTNIKTDKEALQYILARRRAGKDNSLDSKRALALNVMESYQLSSFQDLWTLYEGGKKLIQASLMSDITPEHLFQLYAPFNTGPGQVADKTLPGLISLLRNKNLLHSVLKTQILGNTPHLIGYVFRLPHSNLKKTKGQILVSANQAEVEALSISFEVMQNEETIFSTSGRFWGAVLTPTITGLMGTLLGAVIGFLAFLAQQKHLRRKEIETRFEEKKIESSQKIRGFFTDEYQRYLEANNEQQEMENVSNIRQSLIELEIYAILPRADIARLNQISLGKQRYETGGRLRAVRELLESRFKELMD